jgi:hypothetical protein
LDGALIKPKFIWIKKSGRALITPFARFFYDEGSKNSIVHQNTDNCQNLNWQPAGFPVISFREKRQYADDEKTQKFG